MTDQNFTVGIEEEYLLVDPETRDLCADPPPQLLKECEDLIGQSVSPEFMRCQIEVGTPVCQDMAEARAQTAALRQAVSSVARQHGLEIIASSTHPFATWRPQQTTDKERYKRIAQDIGTPVRRQMICAMHVHCGIADEDLRIDLFNQVRYFLPHLLALATSSPFWQGDRTGLMSYRMAVFSEMPRTGVPEEFDSFGEYQRSVDALVSTGVIEDATKLWWDIRPSARFPTLEMRISDICTSINDGLCVASLYVCLLRMLLRLRRSNTRWRSYKAMLINENRWRAMRYGFDQGMIDFGRLKLVPYPELLAELLELVAEDADALGCTAEVAHASTILSRGTSAHRQLALYQQALDAGHGTDQALRSVVDWLVAETVAGLETVK